MVSVVVAVSTFWSMARLASSLLTVVACPGGTLNERPGATVPLLVHDEPSANASLTPPCGRARGCKVAITSKDNALNSCTVLCIDLRFIASSPLIGVYR
jgi:hypothetical protein